MNQCPNQSASAAVQSIRMTPIEIQAMVLTITNPSRISRVLALAALGLATATASARAQYTPPPPPLTTAPCVPTKKDPCIDPTPTPANTAPAAEKFPFPGDAPAAVPAPASPKSFPFPDDADKPTVPAPATPAAKSFPFPDDAYKAPAESSSSSASSSSGSSSDTPAEPDKPALADRGSSGSTRSERRKLVVKEDPEDREAEDLQVSHYYMTTGNFLAAYLRAKDAAKTIPDDPLAHFAIAESAQKLKKTDEAVTEFKLYLKLDPDGEKAKAAQRSLAELGPK